MNIAFGIVGMLSILTAFILDEFYEKFNQDTIGYNALNIFGAGSLTYYAFTLNSWPFLILNIVWFIVAGIKLVKITLK